MTGIDVAALSSIGAGAIHAAAAGIHAENPTLSRLFVLTAAAQILVGMVLLLRRGRIAAGATVLVNAGAVTAWVVTRTTGISWIDGLEQSESPGFADTVCAGLGALAVVAAVVALVRHTTTVPRGNLIAPGVSLGALSLVAMMAGATNVHSHDEAAGAEDSHSHTSEPATEEVTEHTHSSEPATSVHADDHADHETEPAALAWPRAWDPTAPIDFSGVDGVTAEQQERAETLAANTLRDLPAFADVTTLPDLGYRSIGDAATGFEHFINVGYIGDDSFLDPTRPESLVYQVDGEKRTLVSAMFIAKDVKVDDPELVDWGGPLMQWHVHENLCWSLDEKGQPKVVGVTDAEGKCAPGSVNAGGENPMVHVWIAPHECGPFAALEGHGAGQAATDGQRADQCAHDHGDEPAKDAAAEAATAAYDPTKPIDLSGVAGVTPEQQAYAENLIAVTLVGLPQWSDPAVAEAAGFRSIGDAATGHEHYVNWSWLDDDVWLDPDAPESLVYEPQPDGSKKLVSAMYMLPQSVALADVPDWGGPLMQWHVHDNLCYTDDAEAPQVRGITQAGGTCRAPLVRHPERPMIHVWITPHPCGPFAALEGVGAGTIPEGEERWCDHAHGSG